MTEQAPNDREAERREIQEAASLTGSPWLAYMATYAEPSMTPAEWDEAVTRARHEIRLYGTPAPASASLVPASPAHV